jgi:predicted N-formylglutamate amidohydrolase
MAAPRGGDAFLVTCEHGGNRVPPRYRILFRGHEDLLDGHRGYDPGARSLAHDLAAALEAPLAISTVSRLVVDLNRSLRHPRLFSPLTRAAPAAVRREIVARHYLPYRAEVEARVAAAAARGRRTIHVSAHSFTPVLDGVARTADVGLLYDPARGGEAQLCAAWRAALRDLAPALRVRRNYPYAGKADGLTTHLRRRFGPRAYVGVELEVNQAWVFAGGRAWARLRRAVVDALVVAVAGEGAARRRGAA